MAFNSLEFIFLFPIVLIAFYLIPGRARWAWLLTASLLVYGYYQPLLLIQLLAATAVAYVFGLRLHGISDKKRRRPVLTAGIVILAGNLLVTKYTGFANETLRELFGWFGAGYPIPVLTWLLPIGISFYTLQLIGYLVDVFRGTAPERHFGLFTLYVSFFPKMVAGPIERAGHLLPQLHRTPRFDAAAIAGGFQLILWGAFKKVVVADRLSPFVQQVYDDPTGYNGVVMVFVTLLFAFQIYCDFSGYTDMALGTAQTFGYRLTNNFNRPYLATSIQDFWKRWHISLTSWLTDYVYTPMTRNRVIKMKWYYLMLVSLFVTFVISGLWHGAQWTFVAWGTLHGTYLVCSAMTQRWRSRMVARIGLNRWPRMHHAVRVAITFSLVCIAYILFNATSLADAAYMFSQLGTGWSEPLVSIRKFLWDTTPEFLFGFFGIGVVVLIDMAPAFPDVRAFLATRSRVFRWGFCYAAVIGIVLLGAFYDSNQRFIYFQF